MIERLHLRRTCVFHEGEIALQRSVDMAERMAEVGPRVVRDWMPQQHREFYARLPFILAASVDEAGEVWPTMLAGEPGFIQSPSSTVLTIAASPFPGDPARPGIAAGGAVGLLGIELHTRRRNRVNGLVCRAGRDGMAIAVAQSFGNCPQFIRLRDYAFARDPHLPPVAEPEVAVTLNDHARSIIAAADTFFVASYAGSAVDISHRGGRPGFVRIGADGLLTIPDFAGNFFFNTLGNFLVNPRAGLLFVDFASGDLLQLAGRAEIVTDSPEIATFEGAERLWTFRPTKVVLRRDATPLRWSAVTEGVSARTLRTGTWAEAGRGGRP
jgi:predicted pyridoxine 5'-phosphate oxidase superfamily flavin-nucleotide-binding protein